LEVLRATIVLTASEKSSGDIYAACGFAVTMNEAGVARAMAAWLGNCGESSESPDLRGPQFCTAGAVNAA